MAVIAQPDTLADFEPSDASQWPGAPEAKDTEGLLRLKEWRVQPQNWNRVFDNPDVRLALAAAQNSDGRTDKPFRLRVQEGMAVALRQIHPHNGFWCDLSAATAVVRGRLVTTPGGENQWADVNDDAADAYEPQGTYVTMLEEPFSPETDLPEASGSAPLSFYGLVLQGTTPRAERNPSDPGHYLLADVRARLAALKSDEDHPGFIFRCASEFNAVSRLTTDGGVVRPADDQSPYVHFWLLASLQLTEDVFRPMM